MKVWHPEQLKKIKILGAVLELPELPIQPILPDCLVNGPNFQCCLPDSSRTTPRILIFSTDLPNIHFMWNQLLPMLGCANNDLDGFLGHLCKFIEYCKIVALVSVIPLGMMNNWQHRYNSTILYEFAQKSIQILVCTA